MGISDHNLMAKQADHKGPPAAKGYSIIMSKISLKSDQSICTTLT